MTHYKTIKTTLFLLLSTHGISSNSITFKPKDLLDTSEPSYLQFEGVHYNYSNYYEKITADFNGDGFEDILSLGGDSTLINEKPVSYISAPMEMMLYQDGTYIKHDLGIESFSYKANIVDVDFDGDLDIVMMNGKIAINDGLANFSMIEFTNSRYLSDDFFTADIDADGDLDIISKEFIFKNNGSFAFNETTNNITVDSDLFQLVDINNDSHVDLVTIKDTELQSWINDGSGSFELLTSLQIPRDVYLIHSLDITDGKQNLIIGFHEYSQDKLLSLKNDGDGNFESSQLVLSTGANEFDNLRIGKLYNQDLNNDGLTELMIAASFINDVACQNTQNLLFIYNQSNAGNWQYQIMLHSDGEIKKNDLDDRMTVDSLPTIIDLNNDQIADVVFNGDRPKTWLSQAVSYNEIGVSYLLSQASKNQYLKNIDTADYDNDGYQDIFSAASFSSNCPILEPSDGLYTTAYHISSALWINDGDDGFDLYNSPFGGGNDFLRSYEYMTFADLENDGVQNIIATNPETQEKPQESFYIYPRIIDPSLSFKLPETTINAKAVNLDSTGQNKEIVMIADTEEAPIIILSLRNGQFIEIARLEFGARYGEFILEDMDNDGNIDIIASQNRGGNNATNIWYNNGNREFTKSQDYADNAFGIAVLDINNDGLLDLFSSSRDIRLNRGNREFEFVRYDYEFWSFPQGFSLSHHLVPKRMLVMDFNNDGKDDILFSNHNDYYAYINVSTEDQILFYAAYITKFKADAYQFTGGFDYYNAVIADMNNDDKLDFVVNTSNKIQLNTQVQEQAVSGIYYDPIFSGHGFSINTIGHDNLYYSVFYTFDELGKPEWYSSLNRYTRYEKQASSSFAFTTNGYTYGLSYLYDYDTHSAQINPSSQYRGHLHFSSSNTQNSLDEISYGIGGQYDRWNIQPLIQQSQKPEVDFSGIWWAGSNDSGWGLSLSFVQRQATQEVVAILYFYDDAGEPRWLIGQQNGFQANQEITINMDMVNGFGRDQNHVELSRIPAGNITLNLNQPSNNLNQAGTMTMDVFYPEDISNQGNWIRDNIPISLFSSPEAAK